VKTGLVKKTLLGIFGAFFVLGILITPNPKNATISAAECTVTSARFVPATINGSVDKNFMNAWYVNATPPQPGFVIEVATQNCKDKDIGVSIVEEDGGVNDAVKITDKTKNKEVLRVSKKAEFDTGTITFNFKSGSNECDVEYGPDCDLHFNVDIGGAEIYSSTANDKNRANGGSLDYDEEDDPDKNFIFSGATEVTGDNVGTIWYYELSGGGFVSANSGKAFSKTECQAEANKTNGAKKPVNCTDEPDLDDVVGGALNGKANALPECSINPLDSNLSACIVEIVETVVFVPLSFLAGIAGQFFDIMFEFSISSAIYGGGGAEVPFLKTAWTFIRDIANLGFIIVLLWISILHIVKKGGYDIKKAIPSVIIIALVINFSYFFGTVIIDTTNVLARFLYTNDVICVNTDGVCDGTISEGIVAFFNPQNMIERGSEAFIKSTGQTEMSTSFYAIILILSIWVAWEMFKMFFKIGTLFLGRIVQLWVHLILSPIAFINLILPTKIGTGKSVTSLSSPQAWATEFFKNAMIAPVFMFFLYLIFLLISGFKFVSLAGGTSSFISLITMIFPFFIIVMLMGKAVEVTQQQAGNIATQITGKINGIVGTVAGGALALGSLAFGGAIVKGGSRVLGSISKSMIAREGAGSNMLSRKFNSATAKLGGRLNKYSKELPDKNLDIRKSKISDYVKNATGFDMKNNKENVDKYLGYVGLKPSETYNQREKRKADNQVADMERRTMNEKTEKTDRELGGDYAKRMSTLEDTFLEKFLNETGQKTGFQKFAEAKQKLGMSDDEIRRDFMNGSNKQAYAQFVEANAEAMKKARISAAGSEELFNAKSGKEYTEAAKKYNAEVRNKFVEKKKRDVYGGKTPEETQARYEADQQAGFVNTGDGILAGGQAGVATALGSTIAAGTGIGLAGAALYGANARYDREADIAFLRRMEKDEKTSDKVKKEIEKAEISNARNESKMTELKEEFKNLSQALKENSKTVTDASGATTKNMKEMFDKHLTDLTNQDAARSEKDKWSPEKLENEAFNKAYSQFITEISETLRGINTALTTATGTAKTELETKRTEAENLKREISEQKAKYDKKEDEHNKSDNIITRNREKIDKLRDSIKGKSDDKKPDAPKTDDKGSDKKDDKK